MGTFTNAGGKFYVCATPQPTNLTKEQFEALSWVEVKNVGSLPESGLTTNIVSYDTIDTQVTQKQKGISNAGDGTLELARIGDDPGQVILRTAGAPTNKQYYATKRELTDAAPGQSNTIYYNRGIIAGPAHPGGRNEDFILETFTFGNVQPEVVVNPAPLSAPSNTLLPAIAGIAQQGVVLTALPGTWFGASTFAYQWKNEGADIVGATSQTYTPGAGDVGDNLSVVVTATNTAGSTSATSAETVGVLAP